MSILTHKNKLPPEFKTWNEFYRTMCKDSPHLKDTEEQIIKYVTHLPSEDFKTEYLTTIIWIRAQCFKEIQDDLFNQEELIVLKDLTLRFTPISTSVVATIQNKIANILKNS